MKEKLSQEQEVPFSIDIGHGGFKKTLTHNPNFKIIPKLTELKGEVIDANSELIISGILVSIVEATKQSLKDEVKLPVFFPTIEEKNPYVATGRISISLSDLNSARAVIDKAESIGFLLVEIKEMSVILEPSNILPLTALSFCDSLKDIEGVSSVTPELLSSKRYRNSSKKYKYQKSRRL